MSIVMMTSEERDAHFQPTGVWPTGSYCDLSWSRQRGWQGDASKDFTGTGGIVLRETHVGLVLSTFERNGYSDSDFVAIVWNPELQKIETVEYASTRGWCYPNCATVDATPEVIAAACEFQERQQRESIASTQRIAALTPEFGRLVEITATRGKAKEFRGQHGEICWVGKAMGRSNDTRVGVRLKDGTKTFLPAAGVRVLVDEKPCDIDAQEALKRLGFARLSDNLSALPAF